MLAVPVFATAYARKERREPVLGARSANSRFEEGARDRCLIHHAIAASQ